MCFDVPKVVWSPGCDHGHDEESRNGRDIKIDILDGYVRTLEVFREVSDKMGGPEGYRTPPEVIGPLVGFRGERGQQPGGGAPPPKGVQIGLG